MPIFQGQPTDLTVRCADGKLMLVVASALASSSDFFAGLLKDAIPTETVGGHPVVDLAEGFDETYRALRYADPTPLSIMDLTSGTLDPAARVVLDKYLMLDSAISRISEYLQYANAKDAFTVFGLLRNHGWPRALVQLAADAVLRHTLPTNLDIVSPDHDHVTPRGFQALQKYATASADAIKRALLIEEYEGLSGPRWLLSYSWEAMFRCPQARELWPERGRFICETCHRKDPLEIFRNPGNCTEAWAHEWFMDFINEFAKAVQERPGIKLGSEEWAGKAARKARGACASQDKPAIIRSILVAMDADLQHARDKAALVF